MNGEITTENDGPSCSMSMDSIGHNESVDSIRTVAHILSNLLPLEPNGPSKEEFASRSDETMQGSDELEDLSNVSWTGFKEANYLVAHLAQELVRSHKKLYKYIAAICNNMKIFTNKTYILEDELFCKLLNMVLHMQKSPKWGVQMNDVVIMVKQAIEALLESCEHKHFDLMVAFRV
ncbi:hypothetical protein M422DRAFT_47284 [Sphaerobolus stellatus SS14]|uniref:Uncharacterized protein n=1 Tax=Sphaerobolus stellatus (strain SS14) TaxID=990650 RepID=A0A0C9VC44_SPHS4|nr:hypothetical protein M422DRAFT_47284 [Sphaerobolus stellatus SS14]